MSLQQPDALAARGFAWGRVVNASGKWIPVRETPYTEPAAAAQRSLNSVDGGGGTNVNDTAGGTGARVIRITYFDDAMNGPFTEDVALAGVAFVNTVAVNIRFIEKMEVISTGTAKSNQGIITLYDAPDGHGGVIGTIAFPVSASGGANTAGFPTAGSNRTNWAHHYVAANKTMNLATIIFGLVKQQPSEVVLRAHDPTNPLSPILSDITPAFRLDAPANSSLGQIAIPVPVAGPAIVTAYMRQDGASASGSIVHVGFTYNEY